jgi:hypothetical protein
MTVDQRATTAILDLHSSLANPQPRGVIDHWRICITRVDASTDSTANKLLPFSALSRRISEA